MEDSDESKKSFWKSVASSAHNFFKNSELIAPTMVELDPAHKKRTYSTFQRKIDTETAQLGHLLKGLEITSQKTGSPLNHAQIQLEFATSPRNEPEESSKIRNIS